MFSMDYKTFYKRLGIYKLTQMVTPPLIDASTFSFPVESLLYYFTVSDSLATVTKAIPVLANTDRILVKTVFDYNDNNILGNSVRRDTSKTVNEILKELMKADKTIKFLRPDAKEINLTNKTLMVVNYGAINYGHKYGTHVLNRYYKWYNAYEKMVSQLINSNYQTNRHRFVTLAMPATLPPISKLNDIYSKKIVSAYLDDLPTYEYFNLIDLWRYLTPELKSTSLLSKIPNSELANVNLLLTLDKKVVVIRLYELASLVKDYNLDTKMQKQEASTVRKLLYLLVNDLINGNALPADNITDKEEDNTHIVTLTNNVVPTAVADPKDTNLPAKEVKVINIDNMISDKVATNSNAILMPDIGDEEDTSPALSSDEVRDITTSIKKYATKQDITNEVINPEDKIMEDAQALHKYGIISKNEMSTIDSKIKEQLTAKSPYPSDHTPLVEMLDMSKDVTDVSEEESAITDNPVIFDKRSNRDTIGAINTKYLKQQYKKDIVRTIYALQKGGVLIDNYQIDVKEDILGGMETHNISVKVFNGRTSTIPLHLPKIDDKTGHMKMAGNTYLMRKQRADIPIRKISSTEVALSSNYGKMFISKATVKRDDIGYWLRNKIIAKYEEMKDLKDLVLIGVENKDVKMPQQYAYLSRYLKSFTYKKISYDFEHERRNTLIPGITKDQIKKMEGSDYILVGNSDGLPVVMKLDNSLYIYRDNRYTQIEDLFTQLNIDVSDGPIEFMSIRIYRQSVPAVILLSYYLGLDELLNVLKVHYQKVDGKKQPTLDKNHYAVKFNDTYLVVEKDHGDADIIISGLLANKNIIKTIDYENFNSRERFDIVFNKLGLSGYIYKTEIKMLENMFVDPMTETILLKMKEPRTFKGLLLRAAEMLVDDSYTQPNDVKEMSFKGYERIAGMMYKQLVLELKEHENRSFFSKSKLQINPYSVIDAINEDSTTVLVDDINPIATLKQTEDVTYLGAGGLNSII